MPFWKQKRWLEAVFLAWRHVSLRRPENHLLQFYNRIFKLKVSQEDYFEKKDVVGSCVSLQVYIDKSNGRIAEKVAEL